MKIAERRELPPYEGSPHLAEVWFIVDDGVWLVQCMDCGTRIGTVNAGNEGGAVSLTVKHICALHAR